MICQIYSATSAIEARELLEAGTDFIGIFPVDDPDYQGSGPGDPVVGSHVSFATARDIIEAIRGRGTAVVLSLAEEAREILDTASRLTPDVLHVSGAGFRADRAFRAELGRRVPDVGLMHVVEIKDREASLAEAARLQDVADYLILDSPAPAGIGASGRTHDWEISRDIVTASRVPVILAGGLRPDNVVAAVKAVHPWGVDSFTWTNGGVQDGRYVKDIPRVQKFCAAARRAESAVRPQ